jgi:hypothetical protein
VILVRSEEWGVSFTRPAGRPGPVTLEVYRIVAEPNRWGGIGTVLLHPEHNGREFEDMGGAESYAILHGLLSEYVR